VIPPKQSDKDPFLRLVGSALRVPGLLQLYCNRYCNRGDTA